LALLEGTLRLALGFKWLVEVEPELLQTQLAQPAHQQVLVLCFRAQMALLAAEVLAQVAQTAIHQERVVEVEAAFQCPQQLDLLEEMVELPLVLGCLEALPQVAL
jgi:hypothetical protein